MIEVFNETIFLIAAYHLMLFASTWIYETERIFGKTMILTILIMLVTNYGIIITTMLRDLIYKLKLKYYAKKKAQILQEKEIELAKIRA